MSLSCKDSDPSVAQERRTGPGVPMEDVLERRQCKEDGSASDEYLINVEFMAMLDYYVAVCLSARASEAAGFRSFYAERVLL